jgi:hypothetical protein
MKVDYSKGKIYKITNDYNDDIYIGSTCDTLVKRFSKHRADRNSEEKKHRNIYVLMNDIGFERFRIQLLEEYPCDDKYQLRQKEGEYIRQMGTLNMQIEGRTVKEWRQENKDKIKEYRENNSERIKEKTHEYYIDNRDEILEKAANYYNKNKDKVKEYNKEYYNSQIETLKEKVICICGCTVRKSDISRHQKSQKHMNLMNSKTTESN